MLEVQIYNNIGSKSEQIMLSAFGMEDCIFSADTLNKILHGNPEEKDIKFNIHCDGGSVSEGFAIYDILRTSGRNIHMNIEGGCHSMAIVLLLAAPKENRTGNVNLKAMIHCVRAGIGGMFTSEELDAISSNIKKEEERILDIYEERTNTDRNTLRMLMKAEKERTAEELLKYGFISKINSYNTNSKKNSMSKNGKTTVNSLLKRAGQFGGKINKLLNPKLTNYDYTDEEGNLLFSTESEEDTLAVGDTVTIADGSTDGTFTLPDGRVVTIVESQVTELAEQTDEEMENLQNENEELRNALGEAQELISDLRNQLESNYTPPSRITQPQRSNKKTSAEFKNEAKEKLKKMRGGK